MSHEYHDQLRMALFGNESLRMWGKEALIRDREEIIEDALREIRRDLEEIFDNEFKEYLADADEEDGDMENAVVYFDGDIGAAISFATYGEAVREAEIRWAHLTAAERRRFSSPGCYFGVGTVFANSDIDLVLDMTQKVE